MTPMLRVEGLTKRFGGLVALHDLSFDVQPGEIVGLIGPNGAGKTTAFNLISGTLPPSAGRITFQQREIQGGPPNRVVRLGLARTFQNASVYPKATVAQNIYRGAIARMDSSIASQIFGTRAYRSTLKAIQAEVDEVISAMGLERHRDVPAGALSYGFQKKVGVAVGLATNPSMLLLDEPAAGLNPEETAEFGALLRTLREQRKLTLLLVEHHMALVMGLCDRIVVLVHGQKIAEGTPAEVRSDPAVVESYLGAPEEFHA